MRSSAEGLSSFWSPMNVFFFPFFFWLLGFHVMVLSSKFTQFLKQILVGSRESQCIIPSRWVQCFSFHVSWFNQFSIFGVGSSAPLQFGLLCFIGMWMVFSLLSFFAIIALIPAFRGLSPCSQQPKDSGF